MAEVGSSRFLQKISVLQQQRRLLKNINNNYYHHLQQQHHNMMNRLGGSPLKSAYSPGRYLSMTRQRNSSSQSGSLKTSLHDAHVKKGGKMVDFAGWSMPVLYSDQPIIQSHLHTRSSCSVFDVSHMMQTKIHGGDAVKFIESLVVSDIQGLSENSGTLTLFTNADGGLLDDLIVNRTSEQYLYVVSNAGCREGDLKHMQDRLSICKAEGMNVELEVLANPLLAVQGPLISKVIQDATDIDMSKLYFMNTSEASLYGVNGCRITRCGYTGEDGVEISIPEGREHHILDCLLGSSVADVRLAGLGARDTLRLEAGLCLYGSDISVETTPVEAALAWTIGKRRRAKADFPGADIILRQLKEKPKKKRVGFVTKSGPPPRAGSIVFLDGIKIGHITSGCPSPSLKVNVAMGYVDTSASKAGGKVEIETRNKRHDGVISKMPFLPSNYYMNK